MVQICWPLVVIVGIVIGALANLNASKGYIKLPCGVVAVLVSTVLYAVYALTLAHFGVEQEIVESVQVMLVIAGIAGLVTWLAWLANNEKDKDKFLICPGILLFLLVAFVAPVLIPPQMGFLAACVVGTVWSVCVRESEGLRSHGAIGGDNEPSERAVKQALATWSLAFVVNIVIFLVLPRI